MSEFIYDFTENGETFKVVYQMKHGGSRPYSLHRRKVKRETATQIIDEHDTRFRKDDGQEIGGSKWYAARLISRQEHRERGLSLQEERLRRLEGEIQREEEKLRPLKEEAASLRAKIEAAQKEI